jgi:hypothetical protein
MSFTEACRVLGLPLPMGAIDADGQFVCPICGRRTPDGDAPLPDPCCRLTFDRLLEATRRRAT